MATVIFKAIEECNSRCIYCDVVHSQPRPMQRMPLELLELFFSRVDEFLLECPNETMEITWHGGEPLLLGPDYFEHAVEFQEKHCRQTKHRIRHNIQSNLTLFRREFTPIFKKLGIDSIGSSYEPIPNLRGLGKNRDSETYNRLFLDAIALLQEEGFSFGIIYVVTKLSLARPLEIFRFLSNLSPKGAFMFNAVILYGAGLEHLRVSPEEFADFLGAIFPTWWRNRQELYNVEPFASFVRNLVEGSMSLGCSDSGMCAYSHINLGPDGSLSHCGRSADWRILDYGSILDKRLAEVMADPQRAVLLERNTVLPQTECSGCRFWSICHGGCPLDAWSATGSFMHKTEWCGTKKRFIEKYFEPLVNAERAASTDVTSANTNRTVVGIAAGKKPKSVDVSQRNHDLIWIDPVGGLGDALMISGVLKQIVEGDPSRRFNLVDRTKYRRILEGHPAIHEIGHPPSGATLIRPSYWDEPEFGQPGARAYQILARMFGLEAPVQERAYFPGELEDDPILVSAIPWKRFNILVGQSSDSPRKQMSIPRWESLIAMLNAQDVLAVQATKSSDRYIRGTYSLLGLTTPRQLISLMRRFDAVITADSFLMHAAHLCAVPAVVLWGPTDHQVYGYAGQIHLQAKMNCEFPDGCIQPGRGNVYSTDCPRESEHCVDAIPLDMIYTSVLNALKKNDSKNT